MSKIRFLPGWLRFLVLLITAGLSITEGFGQANLVGMWNTLPQRLPINPIHAVLLRTGKVLVVAGSGNLSTNKNFQAGVWDPATDSFVVQTVSWDMFCNGMINLQDGRAIVAGGTLQYNPTFLGASNASLFDPITETFANTTSMARGRWYPTLTTLGDGQLTVFSGLDENGGTNSTVEVYTDGQGWSTPTGANWTPPLYPWLHLLPDGNLFYSGPTGSSRKLNVPTWTWSLVGFTNYNSNRTYGSSVLLPLTIAEQYRPQVMIFGGGNPATSTTETIDLSKPLPIWKFGPNMSEPRIEMNAVILPSGKVLALGGSASDELATTASYNADLYDPVSNSFSSAGMNSIPRLYHSVALLLPDATVWVAGGNPKPGSYEPRVEIYQPAYLFTTDAHGNVIAANRPVIQSLASQARYGTTFSIVSQDAATISSIVLMRPGAPTHAFDMEQRMVELSFSRAPGSNTLNASLPSNSNLIPPGYYMVFLINSSGVPSVAQFLLISR